MKHKYIFFVSLIFIFTFQINSLAQRNTSELKYLAKNSDAIITGKVVQQKSQWNEDKTRIYTNATLDVEEYIKGKINKRSITVKYPGGEVGEVGELYTHVATLSNDEEVLLFVKKDPWDMNYKILGGEDGKITIYTDKKTGEKITSQFKKVSAYKKEIKKLITEQ